MVCEGNLCRSPMAEGFFVHQINTNQLSQTSVSSTGLNAVVGYPADPHAQAVMKANGIDISQHRARQITEELVRKADLILVMTQPQLSHLVRQFFAAKGKSFLLGHWRGVEIEDPLMQPKEAFEKLYEQISLAWQDWKERI